MFSKSIEPTDRLKIYYYMSTNWVIGRCSQRIPLQLTVNWLNKNTSYKSISILFDVVNKVKVRYINKTWTKIFEFDQILSVIFIAIVENKTKQLKIRLNQEEKKNIDKLSKI